MEANKESHWIQYLTYIQIYPARAFAESFCSVQLS